MAGGGGGGGGTLKPYRCARVGDLGVGWGWGVIRVGWGGGDFTCCGSTVVVPVTTMVGCVGGGGDSPTVEELS